MKLLTITLMALASLVALNYSVAKSETIECIKWEKQSKEIPQFKYSQWQLEQCNSLK